MIYDFVSLCSSCDFSCGNSKMSDDKLQDFYETVDFSINLTLKNNPQYSREELLLMLLNRVLSDPPRSLSGLKTGA